MQLTIQTSSLRQYSWSGALLNMSAALVIIQITWTLPISEARECQQRQYLIPSHLETTASEVKDTNPSWNEHPSSHLMSDIWSTLVAEMETELCLANLLQKLPHDDPSSNTIVSSTSKILTHSSFSTIENGSICQYEPSPLFFYSSTSWQGKRRSRWDLRESNIYINVWTMSLLTPHQRHGKPISSSAF